MTRAGLQAGKHTMRFKSALNEKSADVSRPAQLKVMFQS